MKEPIKNINLYSRLEKLRSRQKLVLIILIAILFTTLGIALGPRLLLPTPPSSTEKIITIQGEILEQMDEDTPLPKLILKSNDDTYVLLGEKNIELSEYINKVVKIKGRLSQKADEKTIEVLEHYLIEEGPEAEMKTLFGTIQPIITEVDSKGTHTLKDEEGKILAYLACRDDKLKISEGVYAQIEGEVIEKSTTSPPLIQVEKIIFK